MSEISSLVQQFKERYEHQAGMVWLTRDVSEVGQCVRQIATERAIKSAVAMPISAEVDLELVQSCDEMGLKLAILSEPNAAVTEEISQADLGISSASFAIAFTGTIVEVSTEDTSRLVSTLPETHIGILQARDVVKDLDEAAKRLRIAYQHFPQNCNVTFISGPSRTADIEMKLFLGVHGPRESHVIIME